MLICIRTFSTKSFISSSSDSLFLIVGISYPWWSEYPIPEGRNSLSLVVGIPYSWWSETTQNHIHKVLAYSIYIFSYYVATHSMDFSCSFRHTYRIFLLKNFVPSTNISDAISGTNSSELSYLGFPSLYSIMF